MVQVRLSTRSTRVVATETRSVGTGGTIAGVGRFVKSMDEDVVIALSDPEGSGLYNKVG